MKSYALKAVYFFFHIFSISAIRPGRQLQTACAEFPDIKITPSVFTASPVLDLKWLDRNDQNVFAITKTLGKDYGGLYHSHDGGKTWKDRTPALRGGVPAEEPVDIIAVFSSKLRPENVVFIGTGTYYWVSNNYGETAQAFPSSGWSGKSIRMFKQHPRKEDWLMLLVRRPGCTATFFTTFMCPNDLMLAKDLFSGKPVWENMTQNARGSVAGFVDFDWAANLCPSDDCGEELKVPEDQLFATLYTEPGAYDNPWDPDVSFVVSNDFFKSFSVGAYCGNQFELIGRTVYMGVANSCPYDITGKRSAPPSKFPEGITLFTSTDAGATFNQACLPIALKQEGYELLETQDHTGVLVIVDFLVKNDDFGQLPTSGVFTSGPNHALFSISLTDVWHSDFGLSSDFSRVDGLPGVYIANQIIPKSGKLEDLDIMDLFGDPLVETRITFNGGGLWQPLKAPTKFRDESCNKCRPGDADCRLHLHGPSSWSSLLTSVPSVYSHRSAPGVIMSSGNVGELGVGLDGNDATCTYLSTDGGVTWSDVATGTYIYEYADWGGILVMARHPGTSDFATDEILFSEDMGQCWHPIQLEEALFVDNIRIEPDGQRAIVLLHGRRCSTSVNPKCGYKDAQSSLSSTEGVIYQVDILGLLAGRFTQCFNKDRELWAVPDAPGSSTARCVLGKQMYVERRKAESLCFNGPSYERPVPQNTTCDCTTQDTECDYGYYKDPKTRTCQPIGVDRMPFCPAIENREYVVSSSGLRQVHADVCQDINKVIPDTDGRGHQVIPTGGGGGGGSGGDPGSGGKPSDGGSSQGKGGKSSSKGRSGLFGFLMFLVALGATTAAFVAWWMFLSTEAQRDLLRGLLSRLAVAVINAWYLLVERVRGRASAPVVEQDLGYFQPLSDVNENGSAMPGSGPPPSSMFTLR